ncbi:hypothetical protein BH09MYX1_BH09MYX1_67310 [soil metagenome]
MASCIGYEVTSLRCALTHVRGWRSVVAWKLWTSQPTAADLVDLLELARKNAGRDPRHIISDRGPQFQGEDVAWGERNCAKPRYGAVGKHAASLSSNASGAL